MKWLTAEDVAALATTNDFTFQTMSISSNLAQLSIQIPILPQIVTENEGLPSATQRWCCQVESRFVCIERELCPNPQITEQVAIYTPFLHSGESPGDWKILLELRELPTSILLTRPLFVESRTAIPNCVIYRPNLRGWRDTVYRSSSYAEANEFLTYLKQDIWNNMCYVGDPGTIGEWCIIVLDQGRERFIGAYPDKDVALKVACEISLRQSIQLPICVRDRSGLQSSEIHKIFLGRVLSDFSVNE